MVRMGYVRMAVVCILVAGWTGHADEDEGVAISMFAVQASMEGRETKQFDRALAPVREALADLEEYDTFHLVRRQQGLARFDDETRILINERYTLIITPLGEDTRGRIRLRARIEEQIRREDSIVKRIALDVTSNVAPGRPLKLCGLRLDEGELVVVVAASRHSGNPTRPTSRPQPPRVTFR